MKRLYRSKNNKIIAGVCSGIAEYFNIDPTIVRLLWLLLALSGGAGVIAYIIAWVIIPEEP
ncbi:MAG: PspC domain-containing protein [Methanosarcina sp.]|jgi:phage shock protein C|nr:PspC domain-containing protein [Methanosarcina sp. Ant1]